MSWGILLTTGFKSFFILIFLHLREFSVTEVKASTRALNDELERLNEEGDELDGGLPFSLTNNIDSIKNVCHFRSFHLTHTSVREWEREEKRREKR